MRRRLIKVVGVTGRMKGKKVVRKEREELMSFRSKFKNCKSERISDTLSWAGKMDSIVWGV